MFSNKICIMKVYNFVKYSLFYNGLTLLLQKKMYYSI